MTDYTLLAIAGVFGILLGYLVSHRVNKRYQSNRIEEIESDASRIIADAKRQSETMVKEAKLEAQDRFLKMKGDFEEETKDRQSELSKRENRAIQREENAERKVEQSERRERELGRKEKSSRQKETQLEERERECETLLEEQKERLEQISGLTAEEAKELLIGAMRNEARYEGAKYVKRIVNEHKEEADKKAKKIMATAIQRYASDFVAERSVSVVQLPSDEMKGRIIGREGRNIRVFQAATGIDLLIDDTPEAVTLSGFNPVRREVARLSLVKLISDGRIHPTRIEETVKKVEKEVHAAIKETGEQAAFDLGVHGIQRELVQYLGQLKFRTSATQNVLQHSIEVGFMCGIMAAELKLNQKLARRMGLLHDIGKAVDHEVEGPHALIGSRLAKRHGESPIIEHAIAAHHEDEGVPPDTVYAQLVQAADALSAARPAARKDVLENYIKRIEDLEKIANAFDGVTNTHAIQAGRELRVIVESDIVSDELAVLLSKDVVKKIEESMTFPGQIKVTVIRETRAVEYANK